MIYINAGCSLFEALSLSTEITTGHAGPKLRDKHHSFDESVDEPASLIEDESVDIEQEIPLEENEPLERTEENEDSEAPVFEE